VTSFWSSAVPSVVLSDLSFSWPDGRRVLSALSASFDPGRTGLVGLNGAGKSTLLRLIAGHLQPSSGSVTVTGDVGYLPQNLALDTDDSVASLLGIADVLDAIGAIEAGDASQAAFDTVGDDWDARDRARGWLSRLGLAHVGLDDPVGRLSGGETIMTALAVLFLRRPDVLLLDEPTNNLDLDARGRLVAAVESWPGVMLIVSHDRELLGLMDQIADLRSDHYGDSLRLYGGNLAAYQAMLDAEQAAARRAAGAAAAELRRERRDLVQGQTRQARRDRQGRQLAASGSLPHAVGGARQRSAQESAGRSRDIQLARIADARARLAEAAEAVRDDDAIAISLPGTAVPAGRTVLTVRGLDGPWIPWRPAQTADRDTVPGRTGMLRELIVRGPERIALTGPNGAGKSTLLRIVAAGLDLPEHGEPGREGPGLVVRRTGALGYLPQRLDVLDDSLTVVENVRAAAPAASVNEVRAGLARFLFRGARADAAAGTLSGGERFRAVLAALLLADPPPQFLLLDEPTNSLDLVSARQLGQALSCYQGALLVASHDVPFLASIGVTRWLRLSRDARLTDIDPALAGQDPGGGGDEHCVELAGGDAVVAQVGDHVLADVQVVPVLELGERAGGEPVQVARAVVGEHHAVGVASAAHLDDQVAPLTEGGEVVDAEPVHAQGEPGLGHPLQVVGVVNRVAAVAEDDAAKIDAL
jgi:ATPase subunit of ABC transporter with duplicated ATPase domains